MGPVHVTSSLLAYTLAALLLAGCATTGTLPDEESIPYTERQKTLSKGELRVSTSVLSDTEAESIYGVPLADQGIQPVWIEVENLDDVAYWLLSPGLDPDFFPASEVADIFAGNNSERNRALSQRFRELAFKNPVSPGATVSGFILTNRDEGVKMVELDLVASRRLQTFSTISTVPGFDADYYERNTFDAERYPAEEITNYTDDEALRAALEALPCCVTNRKGSRNGDPLNLVVIGGLNDAFPALVRRGWHPTESTSARSVARMINSIASGERYRYSPVSPLYLFNRPQDIALQKARDNIHRRNHLRLWLTPMRYHGKPVWVGQISRDIGVRFTIHSPYLMTHKIDPDVDGALVALIEDLAYSQNLEKVGMVKGVGAASRDAPRKNLTTDPYFTNGLRGVLVFDTTPTPLADIEFLPWEGQEGSMTREYEKRQQQ